MPHSVKAFAANSVILLAGCRYSSLHVLIEGEAYAEMTSDEGKVVRVESFRAVEALLRLCVAHKPILEALLGEIGTRVNTLTERLRAAQFVSLREKLADWLLRRCELSGSATIRLEATRERMAELFGVARPNLSRELGALRRSGILELSGREIRIRNIAALRRLRNAKSISPRR